jgi:hypothetical protein
MPADGSQGKKPVLSGVASTFRFFKERSVRNYLNLVYCPAVRESGSPVYFFGAEKVYVYVQRFSAPGTKSTAI